MGSRAAAKEMEEQVLATPLICLASQSPPSIRFRFVYSWPRSRLFILAKFLESGIAAQRIPDRIEPKKGR